MVEVNKNIYNFLIPVVLLASTTYVYSNYPLQNINYVIGMVWDTSWFIALILSTQIIKKFIRFIEKRITNRRIKLIVNSYQENVLFITLVLITILHNYRINNFIGSKRFIFFLWCLDVIFKRNYETSYIVNIMLAIAFNFYTSKKAGVEIDSGVLDIIKENYKLFRLNTDSYVLFGLYVAGIYLSLFVIDKVYLYYFKKFYRSRIIKTRVSIPYFGFWFVTTLLDLSIMYLFQTKTLTNIYICWQQWSRFRQIRSLPPTIIFSGYEIGHQLFEQYKLRNEEKELNNEPVHISHTDDISKVYESKRKRINVGEYIRVPIGDSVPCTILFLGNIIGGKNTEHLESKMGNTAVKTVINTISIDGETNDKEKDASNEETFKTNVQDISYLSDSQLSSHNNIIRQGATVCNTNQYDIWGKIIDFNSFASETRRRSLYDDYLDLINKLSIVILIFSTIIFSCYSYLYNLDNINIDFFIELFLLNNVIIPMTLHSLMNVILYKNNLSNSNVSISENGKKSLISLFESKSRISNDSHVKGAHLSDKTGTLTQNEMTFTGSIDLTSAEHTFISNDDTDNLDIIKRHLAITKNTVLAPNLIPEEKEYTNGFGIKIKEIIKHDDGWETVIFKWKGTVIYIKRLYLGFFFEHKTVFAILDNSNTQGKRNYILISQGNTNAAMGETGLTYSSLTPPSLDYCLEESKKELSDIPNGAQRNWIISECSLSVMPNIINELEIISKKIQNNIENKDDINYINDFVKTQFFIPQRYMILFDKWKPNVERLAPFLSQNNLLFWIITGDNLENCKYIANSINMYSKHIELQSNNTTDLVNELLNLDSSESASPTVIFLNYTQQQLLIHLNEDIVGTEVEKVYNTIFKRSSASGEPLYQFVCYASETRLKGDLVNFIKNELHMPAIYSGDGKNDIVALRNADVGISFPNNNGIYDIEVKQSSNIQAVTCFWDSYCDGKLFDTGRHIWSKAYIIINLIIIKHSMTSGINIAFSLLHNMKVREDPYYPVMYQAFQVMCFGLIIMTGIWMRPRRLHTTSRLNLLSVSTTYIMAFVMGMGSMYLTNNIVLNNWHEPNDLNLISSVSLLFIILTMVSYIIYSSTY
jgi:magnesium-transporting ATPase (P-type)